MIVDMKTGRPIGVRVKGWTVKRLQKALAHLTENPGLSVRQVALARHIPERTLRYHASKNGLARYCHGQTSPAPVELARGTAPSDH